MANMYVINNRFRETVHAKKIKEGLEFHLVEGSKIVAKGLVTKILNLEKPRDFAK